MIPQEELIDYPLSKEYTQGSGMMGKSKTPDRKCEK